MKHNNRRPAPVLWDLPEETTAEAARVTMSGRSRVTVEYHLGLLGYEDTYIEVRTGGGTLRVLGCGLQIAAMDEETILISGRIAGVEYA